MADSEVITLEVDEGPAIAGANRANTALDNLGKRGAAAAGQTGKAFDQAGDTLVRFSDRSRNSVERLTAALEKQAATYGKSGVEKLIAQRDQMIQRLGNEEKAVERVRAAYAKMIEVEQGNKWSNFAQSVKGFIQNPLQSAGSAAESLITKLGPIGGALAAGGAAIGAFALAGFEAAKSLGEFGVQTANTATRMGLTTREVGQFSYAAKVAGSDISALEGTMRKLSQGLADGDAAGKKTRDAMKDLGIEARNVDGSARPMSAVFLQISERLNGIADPAKRDAEAIRLFGRAGVEVLPTILGLSENLKRARELGFGASEEEIRRWEKYHQTITEAESLWDRLVRKIKEPIAATVIVTYKWLTGANGNIAPGGNPKYGEGSPLPPEGSELLGNRGLYAPGASAIPGLQAQYLREGISQSGASRELRSQLETGLEGAKSKLEDLKQSYLEAKNSAQSLAANSLLLPEAGKKAWQELEKARKEYERQSDLVKEIEKDETRRIALLEKGRDLIREGQGFYQVGTGPLATLVTNQQIFDANPVGGPRRQPSLFPGKTYSQTDLQLLNGQQDLAAGPQNLNGELVFVSPSSQRNVSSQYSIEALNARSAGEAQRLAQERQIQVSGIGATAGFQERLVQLTSERGDEISAAQKVAAIRQNALEQELTITGDIVKYREQSLNNELEMRLKIAEAEKHQFDTIKNEAANLFETLITKPSQFGSQLASKLKEALIKPVAEGFGGLMAQILQPVIYGKDGKSGIAGALGGIFGKHNGIQDVQLVNGGTIPVTVMNLPGAGPGGAGTAGASAGGRNPILASGLAGLILGGGLAAGPRSSVSEVIGGGDSTAGLTQLPSGLWQRGPAGAPSLSDLWNLPGGGTPGFGGGVFGPTTPGINGQYPLGGGRGGFGGLGNILGSLKGSLGGLTRSGDVGLPGVDGQEGIDLGAKGGSITGVDGLAGGALLAGGLALGLDGWKRGGGIGALELAGGGAAIGFKFGGPIGAAIGAGIGGAIGLGKWAFGGDDDFTHASKLVRQAYAIDIPKNSSTIKQIVSLAHESFGGSISRAVQSPQVRQLIQLYAESTGQRSNLFAGNPVAAHLVEQGGGLFQGPTYNNGTGYSFASSLPTLGNAGGGIIPSGNPYQGGSLPIVHVSLDPQQTANLWQTGTAAAIAGNPNMVAQSASSGYQSSAARYSSGSALLAPTTIFG